MYERRCYRPLCALDTAFIYERHVPCTVTVWVIAGPAETVVGVAVEPSVNSCIGWRSCMNAGVHDECRCYGPFSALDAHSYMNVCIAFVTAGLQ